MPVWLAAGLWALIGGPALVLGALVAWSMKVPQRVLAGVMAFGAGVLVSALAFELVDEAEQTWGCFEAFERAGLFTGLTDHARSMTEHFQRRARAELCARRVQSCPERSRSSTW